MRERERREMVLGYIILLCKYIIIMCCIGKKKNWVVGYIIKCDGIIDKEGF